MAEITVTALIQKVNAVINEYTTGSDSFVTETTSVLTDLIETAANDVMAVAPNIYCNIGSSDDASYEKRNDGRYMIVFEIQDDMIRPLSIACTELLKPIYEFLPVTDPRYAAQHSTIKGMGAGSLRPLAFMDETIIEGHSVNKQGTAELSYVSMVSVEKNSQNKDVINVKEQLVNAIVYRTAQLVLESENSQAAQAVAKNYESVIAQWAG